MAPTYYTTRYCPEQDQYGSLDNTCSFRLTRGFPIPPNTDKAGKAYLARTKLKNLKGKLVTLKEPYSYFHNAGCSEAQEGYGAVTGDFEGPFGKRTSLMLDCALMGFEKQGKPIFPCLYAVVESSTWKNGKKVGLYNRIPIKAQHLVGNEKLITSRNECEYYKPLS